MQEAADDLVAKLMEDEERDLPKPTASTTQQSVTQTPGTVPSNTALADSDKWFYRDPQGTVQGNYNLYDHSHILLEQYRLKVQ